MDLLGISLGDLFGIFWGSIRDLIGISWGSLWGSIRDLIGVYLEENSIIGSPI